MTGLGTEHPSPMCAGRGPENDASPGVDWSAEGWVALLHKRTCIVGDLIERLQS